MKPVSLSVVVIGGGVFGCATAFQLAKRGVRTTLIECDNFGDHASGKNPGNLNPIHGSPLELIPFALKSFQLHQALAAELAGLGCAGYDLQPIQRVFLAFDESECKSLGDTAKAFEEVAGFSTSGLNANAIMRLDPRLSGEIVAGLLVEGNMSVNSHAFNCALAEGAAKLGATLVRNRVVGLDTENNRVVGVRTPNGSIACDAVVLATGPWVGEIREWLDFDPPVTPVKGEMIRVQLPGAGLRYDFTRGMTSLYRRGCDECWIGVTKEHAGFDESITGAGRHHLLEAAARIMPEVGHAAVLEHVASLRPMSASGFPMFGRVPGWDNAYVANGGGIKGMLLCAGIGLSIAEMIVDGAAGVPINMQLTQGEKCASSVLSAASRRK